MFVVIIQMLAFIHAVLFGQNIHTIAFALKLTLKLTLAFALALKLI